MSYRLKDPNDIKIFILYLLKNTGRPLTHDEFNDVIVQDDLVTSIEFEEQLHDLIATGNIRVRSEEQEELYEVTEQGKTVAETLQSSISSFVRSKALQSALRYLSFKERGVRVYVTTSPRPDGRVDMIFGMKEKGEPMMELSLVVDNDYLSRKMQLTYQDRPEVIYRSILSLLSGDTSFFL